MTVGNNTWEVIEHFAQPSQEALLTALVNGTNAISLEVEEPFSERERDELFREIDLTMIHLYLSGSTKGIISMLKEGMNATIPLALAKTPSTSARQGISYLASTIAADNFEENCSTFLQIAKDNLHLPLTVIFTLSNAYLRNIIHLRTLRLLWEHMKASSSVANPSLKVISSSPSYPEDTQAEEDMIFATTHLVSSTIASADGILLHSSEKDGHSQDFMKRITRNLHHLATYESKLDLQHDPLKGSYYVESETLALAEKIWNKFKE